MNLAVMSVLMCSFDTYVRLMSQQCFSSFAVEVSHMIFCALLVTHNWLGSTASSVILCLLCTICEVCNPSCCAVQLMQYEEVNDINSVLASMDWLELAGILQHVSDISGGNNLVDRAANWLAFGRTRPSIER